MSEETKSNIVDLFARIMVPHVLALCKQECDGELQSQEGCDYVWKKHEEGEDV